MTTPGGTGKQNEETRQEANAPEDADPGVPAATGPVAGDGPDTHEVQEGGPATDSLREQREGEAGSTAEKGGAGPA
jgi:hypothetical protein